MTISKYMVISYANHQELQEALNKWTKDGWVWVQELNLSNEKTKYALLGKDK